MKEKITLRVPFKGKHLKKVKAVKNLAKKLLPSVELEIERANSDKICLIYEDNDVFECFLFNPNQIDLALIARAISIEKHLKTAKEEIREVEKKEITIKE